MFGDNHSYRSPATAPESLLMFLSTATENRDGTLSPATAPESLLALRSAGTKAGARNGMVFSWRVTKNRDKPLSLALRPETD